MPINVFIRQVCCSGTLQAVLQASLINIQRHKTIKAPGSFHSFTHSLIIIARVFDIYIYIYIYIYIIITPKKSQKQTKLSCACRGRAETFIALLYSNFLGAHTHRSPPTESRTEPNRFFRNRRPNFPQNRFLSLALYSPIRCPMHILVLT